jgi:hypothetical protein
MKPSLYLLTLLLLYFSHFTYAQDDRRPNKDRLVVTTFNTYFLWDGIEPEEGKAKYKRKGDPYALKEHMEDIAAIIRKLNPDIVNLVEVENLEALTRLKEWFLSDMNYKAYLIKGTDTQTGQDVGLLTRLDPIDGILERSKLTVSVRPIHVDNIREVGYTSSCSL